MVWESAEQIWYCPFCQKKTIKVHHIPKHREIRTHRGSGQSETKSYTKNPDVTMLSESCSNCGKTKSEIEPKL